MNVGLVGVYLKNSNNSRGTTRIYSSFQALKSLVQLFHGAHIFVTLILCFSLGLGYIAYAQFTVGEEITVRTINVFPDSIEADGWDNRETLVFQNLTGDALTQEFNSINSASLKVGKAAQQTLQQATASTEQPVVQADDFEEMAEAQMSEDVFESDDVATSTAVTDELITVPDEAVTDVADQADRVDVTSDNQNESPIPESEAATEASAEEDDLELEVGSSSALRTVDSVFAYAFAAVTNFFGFTSASTTTAISETEVENAPLPLPDTSTDDETIASEQDSVDNLTSTPATSTSEVAGIATTTSTTSETTDVLADDAVSSSATSGASSEVAETRANESSQVETDVPTEDTIGPDINTVCIEDCVDYSITLGGFGIPLVGENVAITGAQLRVSMAAKKKSTRDAIPAVTFKYSYDAGKTWTQGGEVVIEDEVSNGINGGYFLFALPEIVDESVLDDLLFELEYNNNPDILESLFIESVWLEIFTLEQTSNFVPKGVVLDDNGFVSEPLSGDRLTLPNGKEITFKNTDENSGETLIIKSDEVTYAGLTEVTTYFNVTNTSNNADDFTLQAYFPHTQGDVIAIEEWNQNKPKNLVIPEYRPFVYHCEAGWEYSGTPITESLEDISRFLAPVIANDEIIEVATTTAAEVIDDGEPVTTDDEPSDDGVDVVEIDPVIELATTSSVGEDSNEAPLEIESTTTEMVEDEAPTDSSTTSVQSVIDLATTSALRIQSILPFAQAAVDDVPVDSAINATSSEEITYDTYVCRNTNVVRTCDSIDGDNTACRVENVKVSEQTYTMYQGGWEAEVIEPGEMPAPGLLKRVGNFFGFGPDKKFIPSSFAVKAHTPGTYTIQPGETKYFKMDISFPAFSRGEYWIEAVGDTEYGLLDPFWSSEWTYRMPILIDNRDGTSDLTEQQIFFELDSSLSDFWSNVAADGSDIRFVQEVPRTNFTNAGTAVSNWFDFAWGGRIPIEIPALAVTEDLQNFPVSIDLSTLGSEFWSGVKSDGGDIRVTTSDGIELPIDLAEINTGSQTGDLHFLAPVVARAAANTYYIYYDNAAASGYAATDPLGSQAVWTEYEAVYHFYDSAAASDLITDETGNFRDLVVTGSSFATSTGLFGTALDIGSGSGYLATTTWHFTGGPLYVTGLYYQTAANAEALYQFGTGAQPSQIYFEPWDNGSDRGQFVFGNTGGTTYNFARDNTIWHSFATLGASSTSGSNLVYDNAVLVETQAQTVTNASNTTSTGFQVGRTGGGGTWNGQIDELRVANQEFSQARAVAESRNLANPDEFALVRGAQTIDNAASVSWYSTSWAQRIKISIPPQALTADLTDFPVFVDLATLGDGFFSGVASDGADIRVTQADGVTELPIDVVAVNAGGKTGELHFKTDLSDSTDNEFYIYFNNSEVSGYDQDDIYGSENVWTNGYVAVYHFAESPAGTGNLDAYLDSTRNQYHGDDENTSNDTTGIVGTGLELGDDSNDHIELPNEVLDGLTDVTISGWYQNNTNTDQMILSGANISQPDSLVLSLDTNGTANRFFFEYNNDNEGTTYDNGVEFDDGEWQHFMAVAIDSTDELNFYLNGVGDTENPDTIVVGALSVDNGGLFLGQDQTTISNFRAGFHYRGLLDEFRVATATRDENWAAVEYQNQGSPSDFYATSSLESLQVTNFVELDFWVQHFDATAEEADIWVQVDSIPAGEQAVIYLYYGNGSATSVSDELETFTYSSPTDIYYIVDDSGSDLVTVTSLIDNNSVSLDGTGTTTLDRGESTTFTTFDGESVISVLGPISGTVTNSAGAGDGADTIAPISFATTTHLLPTDRAVNNTYVYSPFRSASVQTYIGTSGTPDESQTVATGTVFTFTPDPADPGATVDGDGVVIESSEPILVMHRSDTPGDGVVAYPPTLRDIYGVDSQYVYLSSIANNPDPTVYCEDGTTAGLASTTRGERDLITNCSAAVQGQGDAVRFTNASHPIAAWQQADGDGNESTAFWPEMEMSTQYFLTNDSAYVVAVCTPRFGAVTLAVQDNLGNNVTTGSCTPNSTDPAAAFFGNANGDTLTFTGGHQIVSTDGVPFYIYYEDVSTDPPPDGDEKNVLGPVQARKFGADNFSTAFGPQELANDARYEQISFGWYQNGDVLTPTSTWLIGGESVSEGIAITGAGAVADGDVLRARMSITANTATGTFSSEAFKLQYATALAGQCDSANPWNDVGEIGSTTATFSGYNNSSINDGVVLNSLLLASSTVLGTYEERNISNVIQNEIAPGAVAEFDWVITATNIDVNTNYCFRMVRADGRVFADGYQQYPELETVGPPEIPTLQVYFDNEKANAFDPVLEFTTNDIAGDDIHYRVQIDDSYDFSSPEVDRNSVANPLLFENIDSPSQKAPFTSGARIKFTSPTTLPATTTYYWRVSASDPDGSNSSSDFSTPFSFSTDVTIEVSQWHQTTGDQFNSNTLDSIATSSGAASLVGAAGTITSTPIDFDDATVGNIWGTVSWNDTETSGTNLIQIEYNNNGTWTLISDDLIANNSVGTSTSPIVISGLDSSIYNEIRLIANLSGTTVSLEDWTVEWAQRVEIPTQGDPFDNEKLATTLPVFDFFSTDPQNDQLEYELSISTDRDFLLSSSTFNSSTSPGFVNVSSGGPSPYDSGDTITYTTQGALSDGETYWWRTRARDPYGGNAWSPWSEADAFTIESTTNVSTWYQTSEQQFEQGIFDGTRATTSGSNGLVELSDTIGEYGTVTLTDNDWLTVETDKNYNNMVVVASGEYDGSSFSNNRTPRVRNKTTNSFEIKVDNYTNAFSGTTIVDYIVMEAGSWTIDDGGGGIKVIAGTESDVSTLQIDLYTGTIGTVVNFSPTFDDANPVALLTISSDNDSTWVATHVDSGNAGNAASDDVEVTSAFMRVSMARSRAGGTHDPEDIDYIVLDSADGTNSGVTFEAFNSADQVDDVQNQGGYSQAFQTGFATTPGVTVVHNNAEDGGNGGFALKDTSGAQNASSIFLSTIEDGATADQHTQEIVSIVAFEDSAGLISRLDTGSLTGTFTSEDIIFSDGSGPKFDNFRATSTEGGTSEILYQFEYLVSEGVYALIPDTEIPGNSVGTTSKLVDLTDIDINTYATIRVVATMTCAGGGCPELEEWHVEWSEGVNMSGTLREYDRTTPVTSGFVRAAVNNGPAVVGSATVAGDGTWTLTNVTAFEGDTITVWVDGAATDADRAVTVFEYDGLGDITGVALYENHLAFEADEDGTLWNGELALYDYSASGNNSDIFFDVDLSGNLTTCAIGNCTNANIYVGPRMTYIASSTDVVSVTTHDFINDGIIELDANTFNVSGSWDNNATSSTDTSTINLIATSTSETITSTESPLNFHNLSMGAGAGTAVYTITDNLDLSGYLTTASGTLARGTSTINLQGSLTIGAGASWTGLATTTFDGSGSVNWSDAHASTSLVKVGDVVIDGANKTVIVTSDVAAYDITIGSNDTLSAGANNILVAGDWTNTGTFLAGTSNIEFVPDDRSYLAPIPGSVDWYADTSFVSRVPIVIQDSEVSGPLTNFPIYVDLSTLGADFWSGVQSDGRDIRMASTNGTTELPYELVEFDAGNETGELHFLADSVSASATTTFYLYFNNATAMAYAADDTHGSEAVWAEYEAVWHFSDDPTSLGNFVYDSTANDRDLVVLEAAMATTAGTMGTALNASGTDGYLLGNSFTWQSGDPLSATGLYFMSAVDNETLFEWGTNANPQEIEFRPWNTGNDGRFYFGRNNTGYTINPRDPDEWHHFQTVGPTSTSENLLVFEDGVQLSPSNPTQDEVDPANNDGIRVGGNAGGDNTLAAYIDELRIAAVKRNSDWAQAENTNQRTPTTFYATSSVETFVADTVLDEATHNIAAGGSNFYDITFNDATTSPAFIESTIVITGDFIVATGTVALPTNKLTVGGSFLNYGTFMHNNNEVEFTGTGAELILLNGIQFLNQFYDLRFNGSGNWTFLDANATTSNTLRLQNGLVTFPSGVFSIGGTMITTSGDFNNNDGTVLFTSLDSVNITTGGSSFENVVFGDGALPNWYDAAWGVRTSLTIASTSVVTTLIDFPLYVDMSLLGPDFWNSVAIDGADIRVTDGDGKTELAYELVTFSTTTQSGEMYVKIPLLSSTEDSTIYIYTDSMNALAYDVTDPYGRNAVWSNNFIAVYHLGEEVAGTGNLGVYIDSTGNGFDGDDYVAAASTTGRFGRGQEFDVANVDYIQLATTTLHGQTDVTTSWWYRTNNNINHAIVSGANPGDPNEFLIRLPNNAQFEQWESDAEEFVSITAINDDTWKAYHAVRDDTNDLFRYYIDGVEDDEGPDVEVMDAVDLTAGGLVIGQDQDTVLGGFDGSEELDGFFDELRFASEVRSAGWIATEYNNQLDPTSFFTATSSDEVSDGAPTFTLNEANTDADGDVTVNGAVLVAPTDTFTIGGSALNSGGTYDANNATTTFNSTNLNETIDFGTGIFHNLAFDGVGGGWSLSTTTIENNLSLLTGASFVQDVGTTISVAGRFINSFNAASTTWTGSTLVLTGGDYTVTNRLDSGDDYATVQVSGDTDIVIWNSTIATSSIADTSSIYMPDFGGINGQLNIYGNYIRTTGAEYWSYATDFDGTDISGTPRQANVLIASSSRVVISNGATLNMVGTNAATTSVDSLAGTYTLQLSGGVLNAQYFAIGSTSVNGFELLNSTTVTDFSHGSFAVASGTTGITVDKSTIEAQPSTQYNNFTFTFISGTSTNVTASGTPNGYWAFANGGGDLYGEAYDNDTGDPGSIQWDDSNFNIAFAGVVYADDGVTPMGGPVCDGISPVVTVVVNGSSTFSGACNPVDGSYRVNGVSYVGEPKIMAYLDHDVYASNPTNVTLVDQVAGAGNITGGEPIIITRPTVIDGDLLVAIIGKDNNAAGITAPDGWALAAASSSVAGNARYASLWYRVVNDSTTEPADYIFINDDGTEEVNYWMGSFRGAQNDDPFEITPSWFEVNNDTTPEALSRTTVTDGSYVLAAWYVDADTDVAAPGGLWTTIDEDIAGAANNLSIAGRLMNPADITNDVTISGLGGGDDSLTGQFVIKRAELGGGTTTAATVTQTPIGASDEVLYREIVLRDQQTGAANVAPAGNISVTMPTVEDNDVVVAIIGRNDDADITGPAGWTLGKDLGYNNENQAYAGIWYHVVTDAASEPAGYDFVNNDPGGTENYSWWVASFENVDSSSVFDIEPAWTFVPNDTTPTAAATTTVTDNAYVLAAWYIDSDPDINMPGGFWTTLAEDVQFGNLNLSVASLVQTDSGLTEDATLSGLGGGDDTLLGQFALRPTAIAVANEVIDFDLYANRVIVRHEDTVALTIADMTRYDNDNDSDIPFVAATSTTDTLDVLNGNGLFVWGSKIFEPGGDVDLQGYGVTAADGSLRLGMNAAMNMAGTDALTIGGSFFANTGSTYEPASSLVTFTATSTGQQIGSAASSTITFYDVAFTGTNGGWAIQTPIVSETGIAVDAGTVSGVANITIETGSLSGDGLVDMTGGTTLIKRTNTLGGANPWAFYNLTLGNGINAEFTTPASDATTTVRNVLTVATGHFYDLGSASLELSGSGNVFVKPGNFVRGSSSVRYSGATPNILRTGYHNLIIDTAGAATVATAPTIGLQVFNNLIVGSNGTSTLNLTTNDPLTSVAGNVYIGPLGTVLASDSANFEAYGSWNNDGVFTANGGLVGFRDASGASTIAAGDSPFADVTINGGATFSFTEHATATNDMNLTAGNFVLAPGQVLAVGNMFTNSLLNNATTWSGSTLRLYGDQAYDVNSKSTGDTYNVIVTASTTQPRFWNATATIITTQDSSSVYSRNHQGVSGDLYIFGDYRNSTYDDYWSYSTNFDGTALGTERQARVFIESGGSVYYTGGSLTVAGTTTATTTVAVSGGGTYEFTLGGNAAIDLDYYQFRDTTIDGVKITGAPTVADISNGDFLIEIAGGSGMTIGGGAIGANPARNFTNVAFATTSVLASAINITATGSSPSSWRFVSAPGNLVGEQFDVDPGSGGGDPGYIVWADSAAIIDISGTVYADDGVSTSAACDGTTNNVFLSMDTVLFASTTCNGDGLGGGTGAYTFSGINYGLSDVVTIYIDDEPENGVTVTQDPISSINGLDIYENHVILRHEAGLPLTIDDLVAWDSSNDADILFTATNGSPDTLVLPADTKLVVWDNKTFAPGGNVTISGGGAGAAYDGSLELQDDASYTTTAGEIHTIGGSLETGSGAVYDASTATTTFTTTGASRIIDINNGNFHNLAFTGSGSWIVNDANLTVGGDFLITGGAVTLPAATTTINGSFVNVGGSFVASDGLLYFDSTSTGEVVTLGGSDVAALRFDGAGGSWTMTDVNATATRAFSVAGGAVTLPAGIFTVGADFVVTDTVVASAGTVVLATSTGAYDVTLSGNDLFNLVIADTANYTVTDLSAALLGDLSIATGSLAIGDGTFSIGGSLDAANGTFDTGSSSVLFNSSDAGETIDPGANVFYDLRFTGASGGWTIGEHATVTRNFTLSSAANFALSPSRVLYVGGVFTNDVGGGPTTWTGSTVVLDAGFTFETNIKTAATELYGTLVIGADTDVSMWQASSTNLVIGTGASLYSQDHAGNNGDLAIFGDYRITSGTEHWSYATDFDGVALGGGSRQVTVTIASGATTTVAGGTLSILGNGANVTTIESIGMGQYELVVERGTFNSEYFTFDDLNLSGLQLLGTSTVTSLDNGTFNQAVNNARLITLASTTLDANASLIITGSVFTDGGFTGGVNVSLDATTTNSWSFTGHSGNLAGEDYDEDGTDACSSIRWDDSDCLLTEQTHYRWRNDDGGEGAAPGTWYDNDWGARQRIRIANDDAATYTDQPVKMTVAYDGIGQTMQADFDDLRFTDDTGTALIPYWIERFNSGVSADVWVQVPSLPGQTVTDIYMYYDNVSVTTTSSSTEVFLVADDFDDNNLAGYEGDTGLFDTGSTFAFGGGFGLDTSGFEGSKATDGIFRTDISVNQGEIIRFMQYIDTTPGPSGGTSDEPCTLFGVQPTGSPAGSNNENYGVCLKVLGTDRVSLVKDAESTDQVGGVSILASTTDITYSTGWYEVEIDWQTDDTIDVYVYTEAGTLVATTSAVDSSYTSGGIGFTYWGFHGGWDSYVSRLRTDTKPSVYFGAEQVDGGASWAGAQDTATGGFNLGETARLRIAIENTGLAITAQQFQLQFAPKGVAPSCESVSGANYTAVPPVASCGSSGICMTTSASTTDNDVTTDHLTGIALNYTPGRIVADTNNKTSALDVDQREFTELEYAIAVNSNATDDRYCFRVTDNGTPLDSYAKIAELTLSFDPVLGAITLNGGLDIEVELATTTRVYATGTVTDLNGVADLLYATSTIYRSGVSPTCTADNNNCYISANSPQCTFTDCGATSCTVSCYADIFFHADPTDFGTYSGEDWSAFVEVEDASGGYDMESASPVELGTMRGLDVVSGINYGTVDINQNTGSFNPVTTINNIGNEAIDVNISGTDMTDGGVSTIPATQQRLSTTTFDYSSCGAACQTLTQVGVALEVDLDKPTTDTPPVDDDIYWGVEVPFGINSAPHSGVNTFTAIGD